MITSSLRSRLRVLRLFWGFLGVISLARVEAAPQTRLLVDLSAKPESWGLSAFDLCVLRVDAQVDLEAAHALGHQCLARVPLFEVPSQSAAATRARQLGVPLLDGSTRGMSRLDATHAGWASVVVHEIVETAAERGFDGVVLCELETISQDAERAAVLNMLAMLRQTYPDKRIFMEGGFDLLAEARRHLDGILFLEPAEAAEAKRLEHRLREANRQGVQPYVVAFADPEQPGDIAARTTRFRELGAVPFFTTRALDGVHLGPLQEITRRVLVLHSGEARETFTAKVLHGSLEWLGYQLDYQDVNQAEPSDLAPGHHPVSAVILDQTLKLDSTHQNQLAALTVRLASQQLPLLLTSQPWQNAQDWQTVATALGLRGTGKEIHPKSPAKVQQAETALLLDHGQVKPRLRGLRDIQAPAEARIILSVESEGTQDQVFLTSWGGVWLDPLALELGPQIHPLPFLESWLAGQALTPVADTTCLDGRRLLVSQISAEGFAKTSSLPGLPLAAEAMQEQVISRYALPMTVSICEGDVNGWTPGHEPRLSLRMREAARAIFRQGHVEAASYSLSRPESWQPAAGKEIGGALNASAPPIRRSMEREIAGSMAYIHRQLLPAGRHVPLMSWPQSSQPSREAVAFTRSMSLENIETMPPTSRPWSSPVLSPRSWGRDMHFQTWLSPLLHDRPLDAKAEILAAQSLGAHRWLTPVQLSLQFQDATSAESLKEVTRLLDWCASQPLQAIPLSQYAKLCRDAAETRFFQTGPQRWIIVNKGQARTLRLPVHAGVPDLEQCTGVAGYVQHGDQIYIHTLGLRRTELVMRQEPERHHLRLATSSASVSYLQAGNSRALLQVDHSRPVELSFAGLIPGTLCQMIANGQPDYLMADPQGRIDFTVPPRATVQLRILPTHQAAMR